jgi:hypothetical protein
MAPDDVVFASLLSPGIYEPRHILRCLRTSQAFDRVIVETHGSLQESLRVREYGAGKPGQEKLIGNSCEVRKAFHCGYSLAAPACISQQ